MSSHIARKGEVQKVGESQEEQPSRTQPRSVSEAVSTTASDCAFARATDGTSDVAPVAVSAPGSDTVSAPHVISTSNSPTTPARRVGVVIANTGSPDDATPEAVGRYLLQFLSHPRICPMNPHIWKFILRHMIVPRRRYTSSEKYKTVWTDEGFTFIRDHERLAQKLSRCLSTPELDVEVLPAMSFGSPSVPCALDALIEKGCSRIFVFPLYPQNAFSQAQIVADDAHAHAQAQGYDDRIEIVGDYSADPMYLRAIAQNVLDAGFNAAAGDMLVMSFHSIPMVDVEHGDTYAQTTQRTTEEVARILGLSQSQWRRGYQSRFDKERTWVSPFTKNVLDDLAKRDLQGNLYFVCPNFSVDCLETYYDIGSELEPYWNERLRLHGKTQGDVNDTDAATSHHRFVYVPCLNDTDRHVDALAHVLEPYLAAMR